MLCICMYFLSERTARRILRDSLGQTDGYDTCDKAKETYFRYNKYKRSLSWVFKMCTV